MAITTIDSVIAPVVAITLPASVVTYAVNDVMNGAGTSMLAFTIAADNNARGIIFGGRSVCSANNSTLPNIDLMF